MLPSMFELLKTEEGFDATPYLDTTGNWTVGYGTNLSAGITRKQAELLALTEISAKEDVLNQLDWYNLLDDVRKSVISNMAYNMGVQGVLGFYHMIQAIYRKDFVSAAEEMVQSEWAEQVGMRADRLADIMRTGVMPDAVAA